MMLSIILPTIRFNLLQRWYDSFIKSYTGEFELIIISPYEIPSEFKAPHKYINDWGSPLRCQQLGLIEATSDYIHRAVDDAIYLPNTMDNAMKLAGEDRIVNIRFIEGAGQTHRDMFSPEFYNVGYHIQTLATYTPFNYQVINFGIYPTKIIKDLGGWNCEEFETIAIGELDLSLRLQFFGAKVILNDETALKADWIPGEEGDHGPLHRAFADDMIKYKRIYGSLKYEDKIKINIDNWKDSEIKWERRFGK